MAHITRFMRKDGVSYRVQVFVGKDANGNKIILTRTYKDKDLKNKSASAMLNEVKELAEKWEAELRNRPDKTAERPDKVLLTSFISEWHEWLLKRAHANIISEATVAYYIKDFRIYCEKYFEHHTVEAVTPSVAKRFISDLRTGTGFKHSYSAKSTSHALTAINSYFTFLIDEKMLISSNPFTGMKIPRDKKKSSRKKTAPLSKEEYSLLIKAIDTLKLHPKWKAFFKTMLTTGVRVEEMVALKWNALFEKDGFHMLDIKEVISITTERKQTPSPYLKTDESRRMVRLPELAFSELMDWRKKQEDLAYNLGTKWKGKPLEEFDEQYIFCSQDGSKHMNKNMPARMLHKIIHRWNQTAEGKKYPIKDINATDLRHTNTTLQLTWGVPPTEVAHSLGHVNLTMVNTVYGHIMAQKQTGISPFDLHAETISEETMRRTEVLTRLGSMSTEELEKLLILADKEHATKT